uniref:Secreted protein n=1 Tax=Drosophila melanogaster TaxID=7227 RepID=X2JDD8_DROME|nr:uncharacterized protein Dmel_CG45603 [Drosophila melanogaster]AHN59621.1 uncharacterized protein Dmel_CG45603 [Drosophila melanogaster]|eukprot:NP_001285151.1 uncharacterized protein Dmel_CG45603 [Drosophila melanogaster]
MGILATLQMIHLVCAARWRRGTADDPGANVCGHIPKLHRGQEIQFSGHVSNSGRSDFDDRTMTSVKYLGSVGSLPQSRNTSQFIRWPLNLCNDIRQKFPLLIENSKEFSWRCPSRSSGWQG